MRPKRDYIDYLRDILETAAKAESFVEGVDFESFLKNDEKVFASVRALEIIGEAARYVPKPVHRRYPEVPWKDMVAMRDKLIHGYFGVDLEVVWRTVRESLPVLRAAITRILEDLEGGDLLP